MRQKSGPREVAGSRMSADRETGVNGKHMFLAKMNLCCSTSQLWLLSDAVSSGFYLPVPLMVPPRHGSRQILMTVSVKPQLAVCNQESKLELMKESSRPQMCC